MKLHAFCVAFAFPIGLLQAYPSESLGDFESDSSTEMERGPNSEVIFFLFTKTRPSEAQLLNIDIPKSILETNFDFNKPTKVLVHGWTSNANESYPGDLRDAYIKTSDANVITVDWSSLSTRSYLEAAAGLPLIADFIVRMIGTLLELGLSPDDIHLLGHSLGAHIVGIAGLRSPVLLPRVTGFDPAGPTFSLNSKLRISTKSAEFVDVIHTCTGLSMPEPLGHVDFYPNGGLSPQPGCVPDLFGICSHNRAHEFYAESVYRKGGFIGTTCPNYLDFLQNKCPQQEYEEMGENTPRNATGIYYLRTNQVPPFGQGYPNQPVKLP